MGLDEQAPHLLRRHVGVGDGLECLQAQLEHRVGDVGVDIGTDERLTADPQPFDDELPRRDHQECGVKCGGERTAQPLHQGGRRWLVDIQEG